MIIKEVTILQEGDEVLVEPGGDIAETYYDRHQVVDGRLLKIGSQDWETAVKHQKDRREQESLVKVRSQFAEERLSDK